MQNLKLSSFFLKTKSLYGRHECISLLHTFLSLYRPTLPHNSEFVPSYASSCYQIIWSAAGHSANSGLRWDGAFLLLFSSCEISECIPFPLKNISEILLLFSSQCMGQWHLTFLILFGHLFYPFALFFLSFFSFFILFYTFLSFGSLCTAC